jgi:hypothetical protein
LDWTPREHSDHLFGELTGKSRWRKLEEIGGDEKDAEYLSTGWLDEVKETGLVESYVVSDEGGWTARQVRSIIISSIHYPYLNPQYLFFILPRRSNTLGFFFNQAAADA